jgi:integrase/recombinase XerD
MTEKLETVLEKISTISNATNSSLVQEFYQFMVDNRKSDSYKKNNLKALILFSHELGPDVTFYDVQKKEKILEFLNRRIKSKSDDPDEKWITTWNDYLGRLKFFFRWLYNYKIKKDVEGSKMVIEEMEEWETPEFIRIRKKKTKRDSPYSEAEIWEQDELLTVIKYEPYTRNKAALALFWDFNARNHEVTKLKIKNIRLRERYGEGEVPYEAKTGSGPILLTFSFPYVRDLLNQHPLRNSPDAALIYNLINSRPVTPDAMWTMMKQLRLRIIRMLESAQIKDSEEKQKLEYLLRTKKWNPYVIRHSAITSDADYLPEFALKKKVRWSMNSRQPSRYIKKKMGQDLKNKILAQNGIIPDIDLKKKPPVIACPRCSETNPRENKFCSKCSYPLVPEAYDEIKASERKEMDEIKQQYNQMNVTLQNIIAIMVTADESTKKKLAQQLIQRGGYMPESSNLL